MEDNDTMIEAEPVVATLNDSVTRSGLLRQLMGLSCEDKVASDGWSTKNF